MFLREPERKERLKNRVFFFFEGKANDERRFVFGWGKVTRKKLSMQLTGPRVGPRRVRRREQPVPEGVQRSQAPPPLLDLARVASQDRHQSAEVVDLEVAAHVRLLFFFSFFFFVSFRREKTCLRFPLSSFFPTRSLFVKEEMRGGKKMENAPPPKKKDAPRARCRAA